MVTQGFFIVLPTAYTPPVAAVSRQLRGVPDTGLKALSSTIYYLYEDSYKGPSESGLWFAQYRRSHNSSTTLLTQFAGQLQYIP